MEQRNFVTFYGDFAQKGRGRKKVLTFLAGNGIIIGLKMRMILKLERGWEWKVSLAKFSQLLLGPRTAHLDSVELRALGVQHLCSFFAARQEVAKKRAQAFPLGTPSVRRLETSPVATLPRHPPHRGGSGKSFCFSVRFQLSSITGKEAETDAPHKSNVRATPVSAAFFKPHSQKLKMLNFAKR